MTRWWFHGLSLIAGLSLTSAATAQQQVARSGYLIIRVIVDSVDAGGVAGLAPGGGGVGSPGPGGGSPDGGGGVPQGPRGGGGGLSALGAPGGGGAAGNSPAAQPKSVVVCVPFTNMTKERLYPLPGPGRGPNPSLFSIKSKYGKTFLFSDNSSIQFYPYYTQTYESSLKLRHQEWGKNRTFAEGYRLCKDALTFGMLDEAFAYSRELAKLVEGKKDVKAPVDVQEFVTAFNAFEKSIDEPPAKANDAESWRQRVQGEKVSESIHYALIHPQDAPPDEINRRLTTLEKNFKAFYLWHAISRKVAKLPEKKLVVILPKSPTDVERLKRGLDGSTIVSDATYTQFHNLVVLSPERLDDVSRAFQNLVRPLWSAGYNPEELMKGIAPKSFATRGPNDHARAMTLALVSKAMEDEADFAALSREGTRQLYIASGVLPQNVNLPEWVEYGSAALFQKPKGPVFNREGNSNTMAVGLVAGYGAPNFHYRRHFLSYEKTGKLNPNRSEILINTISDAYFEAARAGNDLDPAPVAQRPGASGGAPGTPAQGGGGPRGPRGGPGGPAGGGGPGVAPPPGGGGEGGEIGEPGGAQPPGATNPDENPEEAEKRKKEELELKAKTLSWALTYYLSKERLAGLQDFYAQLHRMPRDLHLDDKSITKIFCRSFNLMKGDEIDVEELDRFAKGWIEYMKFSPTFHLDVPLQALNSDPGSGGGMGPGGGMGMPGGGMGMPGGPGGGAGGPGGGAGGPGGSPP